MLSSLRSRLLLSYLLVASLVLFVVGVSFLTLLLTNSFTDRVVYQRLDTVATAITVRESATPNVQPRALQRLSGLLGGRLQTRALVLDAQGNVQSDTAPQGALPETGVLAGLASLSQSTQGRYTDSTGRIWLYVAAPLDTGRMLVVAAPRLTLSAVSVGLVLEGLPGPLLAAAGLALLASLILAWLLARWISEPLRKMAGAARRVAEGDYAVRIPLAGPAEAQEVAATFNEMVREVDESHQAQREFVANVSHELKTPLTSIQGFAQAIKDGTAADPTQRQRAAQIIYDESDRLRRLVEALLDLARLEAGQVEFARQPVALADILKRVADQQAVTAANTGVSIERMFPKDLPGLIGDGDRLSQVFINLLANAVQHSPPGGKVQIDAHVQGGRVWVAVSDQGDGIRPEDQKRIFERFYQVDKARPGGVGRGTGLGLSISREIVSAHGGEIRVESQPGQGTRFTVDLPLSLPNDTTYARRR
jgi:two-component system, OmpR family, sensor kinase